jgi:hypothetical protein
MTVMVDESRRTAIHEAGHAVIGRILGMVCGHATIRAEHDSSGHAVTEDPWSTVSAWERAGKFRDEASVWRGRIMTFQAGSATEIEILGACGGGDEDDRYQISLMAEPYGRAEDKLEALRRHTHRLIRRHRVAIERVANALIDRKRLGARQLDALVWPEDIIANQFVNFRLLRKRFGIKATLDSMDSAMRLDLFPRGYFLNGRVMWRIRDVEEFVFAHRQARASSPPTE